MKKQRVSIDGQRLRTLITEHCPGKLQKQIAVDLGVSEFVVSRWLTLGIKNINNDNVEKLANYCGMSFKDFVLKCAPAITSKATSSTNSTSPSEKAWLNLYKGLGPVDQARLMVMAAEWVEKNANQ